MYSVGMWPNEAKLGEPMVALGAVFSPDSFSGRSFTAVDVIVGEERIIVPVSFTQKITPFSNWMTAYGIQRPSAHQWQHSAFLRVFVTFLYHWYGYSSF